MSSSNLCEEFIKDLQTKQLNTLEKWFNNDSEIWLPPAKPAKGKKAIMILFRIIFKKYADLNWQIKTVYDVGSNIFVFKTYSWGQFATGRPYQNHILTEVEFDSNNQIKQLTDYFSDTAIFTTR